MVPPAEHSIYERIWQYFDGKWKSRTPCLRRYGSKNRALIAAIKNLTNDSRCQCHAYAIALYYTPCMVVVSLRSPTSSPANHMSRETTKSSVPNVKQGCSAVPLPRPLGVFKGVLSASSRCCWLASTGSDISSSDKGSFLWSSKIPLPLVSLASSCCIIINFIKICIVETVEIRWTMEVSTKKLKMMIELCEYKKRTNLTFSKLPLEEY
uniref:Uncharacterized protein n=1 Tax=Romanomermis culicivorax TaxID=13658 RepID=A0A915IK18_ROMCU